MSPHTRPHMTLALLIVLCVAIVAALHMQVPKGVTGRSPEQVAPTGNTEQPAMAPVFDASATTSANPLAADEGDARPARAGSPTVGLDESDGSTNVPEANADATPPTSDELERQVSDAIPHVEQPRVAPDAEYEPGVVLVSVAKGTTAEQLAQAMEAAGITNVERDGIEAVTDDLMTAQLAPGATIDDAIYELESSGVAKGAQPNYVYEIAEEQPLVSSDAAPVEEQSPDSGDAVPAEEEQLESSNAEPTPEDTTAPSNAESAPEVTTPSDAEVTPSTIEPEPSDEPIPSVDASTADERPDAEQSSTEPTVSVQSASPTAARDALNDPDASKQWDLDSMDMLDAWEFPPLKNATQTVGVGILDNGFNDSHEDLADNVRSTYYAPNKIENVPVLSPTNTPSYSHGSHVAGIVAATSNNGKGVSGVGLNHLKLSLVNLTDRRDVTRFSTNDIVAGFDYLIKHKDQYNIRVASISIGGKVNSMPKDSAILKKIDEAYGKDIVTVASAGNQTASAIPPYINYPSDYETVVSVMNLHNTDDADPKSVSLYSTSNYNAPGETSKNISAPGTNIFSTYVDGYGEMTGTSMAAPHVTGVVGLMYAVNPQLNAAQAKSLLYSSARDIGAEGWDETYGHGEVNAYNAVRAAAAGTISGPEYLAVGSQATYTVGSAYAGSTFSSSDPNVLAVGADGTATAMAAGIAIVSASNGSATVTQQATVLGPITGNDLVAKDGSMALSVTTPDGCGDLAWEWSSSDELLATVTNDGVVHGKGVGSATITATLVSAPMVSLSHSVTVYDARKDDVYVPSGGKATLTPDVPAGTESPQVSWSSTNEQVATVENGTVTAMRAGGAVVSCTIGQGDESVTNVWLIHAYGPIEGTARLGIGQTTQLKVEGIDQAAPDLQAGWTWSLDAGSSSSVATVSDDGTVTGHKLGSATITATRGTGQDLVSFSHTVEVAQASLANAKVTIPRQTYSGKKLTPVPVVTLDGTTLVAGTDYEVVDQDIVNVSSYAVTIRGKGIYTGTATGTFVVEPLRLEPPKPATGLVYTGQPQKGVPEGDYYTLSGDVTGTDSERYVVTATVKDTANTCWTNISASYSIDWYISQRPLSEVTVTGFGSYVYNGTAHTPKPTVTWNGMTLKEDEEYTVSYANNVNAGAATLTITANEEESNFRGSKEVTFSIAPAPIGGATVTLGDALTYTGEEQTQKVASVRLGDVDITEFCDVSGSVVTDAGDYELTVTAKPGGNYTGSVTCPFSVARAAYSVGAVSAADVRDSLDPSDVVLTREDTTVPGNLAITEPELAYGTNTYHWTFTPDDANHEPSQGTVEVTVTGHEWGTPTYEWAEDDATCTARRICANDPTHVEEETVDSVREVVAEPTTEAEGKAILTAEFENEAFEAQTKEVSLPKLPAPDSTPAEDNAGPAEEEPQDTPHDDGQQSPTGSDAQQKSSPAATRQATNEPSAPKLPDTSDATLPVVPFGVAGLAILAFAASFQKGKSRDEA